eukprot:TRINITY_DN98_c0_g2_i1.p1 TRINITY_DN98_c0_g2~~TRINITY_DN98_c0_g2_i1.p1  ORF type:complete len:607 (-),score=166.19 TRINITY_DN98_c0_g2_i1:133-1953(-)
MSKGRSAESVQLEEKRTLRQKLRALCDWKRWSLRRQLLTILPTWVISVLLLVVIVVVIIVAVLHSEGTTLARDAILDQVKDNLKSGGDATAQVLSSTFSRMEKSVKLMVRGLERMVDPSYSFPLSPRVSYFDYTVESELKMAFDDRSRQNVTLDTSVYYLPHSNTSNIDGLRTAEIDRLINATSHIDTYTKALFRSNQDYLILIFGMKNSLYRRYPGMLLDATREYDPVIRPWYTSARDDPGVVKYTGPFWDAFGKGWVISVSLAVNEAPSSSIFLGTASINIVITEIQDLVLELNAGIKGSSILVRNDADGTVVAHKDFTRYQESTTTLFALEPGVFSREEWNSIRAAKSSDLIEVEKDGEDHYMFYIPIKDTFILMTFVSKDDAEKTSDDISDDIGDAVTKVVVSLVIVVLSTIALSMLLIGIEAIRISKPVHDIQKVSRKITQNSASQGVMFQDLPRVKGVDWDDDTPPPEKPSSSEIQRLKNAFYFLVKKLRKEEFEKSQMPEFPENPYFERPETHCWKDGWKPQEERLPDEGHEVRSAHTSIAPPSLHIAPPEATPPVAPSSFPQGHGVAPSAPLPHWNGALHGLAPSDDVVPPPPPPSSD